MSDKCLHATCSCPALPFSDYCGEECKLASTREAAEDEQLQACQCGHEDCGGEIEIPIETTGILLASQAV